jgi:hypothetical protein
MADQTQNPLNKYFRQPQMHLKLPSAGQWYAPGSIEMPVTGEVPIYAMTAKDELTAKTPDALLNGQSTVEVIASCCPAIKDPWKMPVVDLDAILIALRIATYGNEMEFVSVCPHCGSKNEHTANLGHFLEQITCPDFATTVKVDKFEIFIKPQTYYDVNKSSLQTYEEQRLLSVVQNETMDEEVKMAKFNKLFRSVLNMTINSVAKNVAAIKTEAGDVVEDAAFISEFFSNCDRSVWNAVRDRIKELNDGNSLKNIPVACDNEECQKPYSTPLMFELSSFFA